MRLLTIDPTIAIPWEHTSSSASLLRKAREEVSGAEPLSRVLAREKRRLKEEIFTNQISDGVDNETWGWSGIPPVPLVPAPVDLYGLGIYVLYEGHHRREAARRAGIMLPCKLIESDEDIEILVAAREAIGTGWGPMFKNGELTLPSTYQAHVNYVWQKAREFNRRSPEKFNLNFQLSESDLNINKRSFDNEYYPKNYR